MTAPTAWEQVCNTLSKPLQPRATQRRSALVGNSRKPLSFASEEDPGPSSRFATSERKDGYTTPNRLWVEGSNLVLNRYRELHGPPAPPTCLCDRHRQYSKRIGCGSHRRGTAFVSEAPYRSHIHRTAASSRSPSSSRQYLFLGNAERSSGSSPF